MIAGYGPQRRAERSGLPREQIVVACGFRFRDAKGVAREIEYVLADFNSSKSLPKQASSNSIDFNR